MAGRPPKTTADYFPHDANAGNGVTLKILTHLYGNNGYAAWFRLLELLTRTPGHYFDCRNIAKWQFLQAEMQLSEAEMALILNEMAKLEAIDPDLWLTNRVIWCQNLVNRLSKLYDSRKNLPPSKPIIDNINSISTPINAISPNINSISSIDNTQTKLKYTKLKETKEEEEPPLPPLTQVPSSSASSERYYSATNEAKHVSGIALLKPFTPDQQTCIDTYSQNIGLCTPIIGDKICMAIEDYTALWVLDAISEAATHEKRAWAYVIKILQTWKQSGRNNGQKGAKTHGEIRQSVTSTTDIVQQGIDSERREAAKAAARAAGRRPKPGSGLPDV